MAVDSILRAAELGDLCALEIVDDRERERGCHASELLSSDAEAFELYGSGSGDGYGDGYGYGYGYGDGSGDGYGDGYGYGYGDGDGDGYGDGDGSGYGDGDGSGDGDGYGDGSGDGSGYGYGLQISISQADENGLVSPQVSDATKAEGPER